MAHGVHLRRPVRAFVAIAAYAGLVGVVSVLLIASPALALVSSQTKYDRVVAQAERIAHAAFRKPTTAAKIASAAKAASPVATAFRYVAGPVGWAAFGVSAGFFIYDLWYSADNLAELKQAAGAASYNFMNDMPGGFRPPWGSAACTVEPYSCSITYEGQTYGANPNTYDGLAIVDVPMNADWTGTSAWVPFNCIPATSPPNPPWVKIADHTNVTVKQVNCSTSVIEATVPGGKKVFAHVRNPNPPATEPTLDQIKQYLETLPDTDPRSLPQHTMPGGETVTPRPAIDVTTEPVTTGEVPTTVKPQTQVQPGDTVVAKDVPPPEGTTTTQTTTQQTTTQTTTNPDGSETQEETATASCSSASHDQRTFGSVLEAHQAKWNNAPLLSALSQLKTLTWPSTLPVISFSSGLFGSFQVDFNGWGWVFLALKTLILAGASLAAYRIVFVGGR